MSLRIRGSEGHLGITIEGQQQTTWVKVKEFTATARGELREDDYVGEEESEIDEHHHGWDIGFSIDVQDRSDLEFMQTTIQRQQDRQRPQRAVVTFERQYRDAGGSTSLEIYRSGLLRASESGASGRKDYMSTKFEGKFKKRDLV